MVKLQGLLSLLASSLLFTGAAVAGNCTTKEIEKNDKLLVLEHTCLPGDGAPMAKRGMRAFYLIEGGKLERTYDDGTKEVIDYKAGDSRTGADQKAFSYQNVGTTPIRFFIVYPR